jgi:hypothetical protein
MSIQAANVGSVSQLGSAFNDFGVMGFGIAQRRVLTGMTGNHFDITNVGS